MSAVCRYQPSICSGSPILTVTSNLPTWWLHQFAYTSTVCSGSLISAACSSSLISTASSGSIISATFNGSLISAACSGSLISTACSGLISATCSGSLISAACSGSPISAACSGSLISAACGGSLISASALPISARFQWRCRLYWRRAVHIAELRSKAERRVGVATGGLGQPGQEHHRHQQQVDEHRHF